MSFIITKTSKKCSEDVIPITISSPTIENNITISIGFGCNKETQQNFAGAVVSLSKYPKTFLALVALEKAISEERKTQEEQDK